MAVRLPPWPEPPNLVARLAVHAAAAPDRVVFRFANDSSLATEDLTFGELRARALRLAAGFGRRHAAGARALILLPPGPDYIACLFGCLHAGVIAVPLPAPRRGRAARFLVAALDAGARFAFATDETRREFSTVAPGLIWFTPTELEATPGGWTAPYLDADTPAFLQYTSGSTAEPKGVVVTHGGLAHNLTLLMPHSAAGAHAETGLSWLPPFHDFGLVGFVLMAVFHGATAVLLAPHAFLADPLLWLRAITHFRATFSAAPNFAYALCAARATPAEVAKLDLRAWRYALCGAEPIVPAALEDFARAFAPAGFAPDALRPGYGLAENTLIVTGAGARRPPRVTAFAREALLRHRVRPVAAGDPAGAPLVSCGPVLGGQDVVIADPATRRPCAADEIGEIWVAGQSVARGYWRKPEATRATFAARLADGRGPFLRTGDLGFLLDGELHVTGRIKDLVIIGGANHSPQDIELTARAAHPALADALGAAFALPGAASEELAVIHEVAMAHRQADPHEILAALRQAVSEEHQLAVTHCALVRFGSVPRTSSGKVRRHAARELFLAGGYETYFSTTAPVPPAAPASAAPRARALPPAEFARLHAGVARILGAEPAALDPDRPLLQQGLSSLRAVELQLFLEREFGCRLAYEDFFEPWTVAMLATRAAEATGAAAKAGLPP